MATKISALVGEEASEGHGEADGSDDDSGMPEGPRIGTRFLRIVMGSRLVGSDRDCSRVASF